MVLALFFKYVATYKALKRSRVLAGSRNCEWLLIALKFYCQPGHPSRFQRESTKQNHNNGGWSWLQSVIRFDSPFSF